MATKMSIEIYLLKWPFKCLLECLVECLMKWLMKCLEIYQAGGLDLILEITLQ